MDAADPDLRLNRLLALLDAPTLAAVAPLLQRVPLAVGDALLAEGQAIRQVFFPIGGVVSLFAAADGSRAKVEVGTVGCEGLVGLPLFLGGRRASGDAFVQVAGAALRMTAEAFCDAAAAHPPFAKLLQRYTHALLVQVSQSTACNRMHTPVQRCARWLLMTVDRVEGDTFHLTQEFLAQMLGERRPTVSGAASQLQQQGLIRYSRGRITIVDRLRLEDAACRCYHVVRREYEDLLPRPAH